MKTIPYSLKPFFWDTALAQINPIKNKRYIIERILDFGDEHAVRWLFSCFSAAEIKKVLDSSPRISAKSKDFWCIVLEK